MSNFAHSLHRSRWSRAFRDVAGLFRYLGPNVSFLQRHVSPLPGPFGASLRASTESEGPLPCLVGVEAGTGGRPEGSAGSADTLRQCLQVSRCALRCCGSTRGISYPTWPAMRPSLAMTLGAAGGARQDRPCNPADRGIEPNDRSRIFRPDP